MTLFSWWRHEAVRTLCGLGQLRQIGYQWDQDRFEDLVGIYTMAVVSTVVTIFALLARKPEALCFSLPVLAITYGYLTVKLGRPRVVIFERDGRILTPNGIPRHILPVRKLPYSHNIIASIELTTDCVGFGVMLFRKDGFSLLLAEKMHQADARAVAVQLSIALQELRDGLANGSPSRVDHEVDPWKD